MAKQRKSKKQKCKVLFDDDDNPRAILRVGETATFSKRGWRTRIYNASPKEMRERYGWK